MPSTEQPIPFVGRATTAKGCVLSVRSSLRTIDLHLILHVEGNATDVRSFAEEDYRARYRGIAGGCGDGVVRGASGHGAIRSSRRPGCGHGGRHAQPDAVDPEPSCPGKALKIRLVVISPPCQNRGHA